MSYPDMAQHYLVIIGMGTVAGCVSGLVAVLTADALYWCDTRRRDK